MIVTTCSHPRDRERARVAVVAARCGLPPTRRGAALNRLLDDAGAEVAYVVGRARDELRGRAGGCLTVSRGLLHARIAPGRRHPLIAALGEVPPTGRVVDATLGLAHDALHVAAVLGCEVIGIEGSPAIYSLLEEGLARLAGGLPAAARIVPRFGRAEEILASMAPDSAAAVTLSPMFDRPARAQPGFDLLRAVALGGGLDDVWLAAALRVAPTVVVKARRGAPATGATRIRGRSVDYLVYKRGDS